MQCLSVSGEAVVLVLGVSLKRHDCFKVDRAEDEVEYKQSPFKASHITLRPSLQGS